MTGRIQADNIQMITAWTSAGAGVGTILLPIPFDTQAKAFSLVTAYTTTTTSGVFSCLISSPLGLSPTVFKTFDSQTVSLPISNSGGKVLLSVSGISGAPITSTLALSLVGTYCS